MVFYKIPHKNLKDYVQIEWLEVQSSNFKQHKQKFVNYFIVDVQVEIQNICGEECKVIRMEILKLQIKEEELLDNYPLKQRKLYQNK